MNEQQKLWAGDFGDAYHVRNAETSRYDLWYDALKGYAANISTVFEPGAGKGDNLRAIHSILWKHDCRMTGLDINKSACEAMERHGLLAFHGAFPKFQIDNRYDLVVTRGFLIHVPKVSLPATLDKIYELSNQYICLAEYYSPAHRRICYRGNRNAMWTGDFAGMLMKRHPDLRLLRTGFKYWQEGGCDETYFLMEKVQ